MAKHRHEGDPPRSECPFQVPTCLDHPAASFPSRGAALSVRVSARADAGIMVMATLGFNKQRYEKLKISRHGVPMSEP